MTIYTWCRRCKETMALADYIEHSCGPVPFVLYNADLLVRDEP